MQDNTSDFKPAVLEPEASQIGTGADEQQANGYVDQAPIDPPVQMTTVPQSEPDDKQSPEELGNKAQFDENITEQQVQEPPLNSPLQSNPQVKLINQIQNQHNQMEMARSQNQVQDGGQSKLSQMLGQRIGRQIAPIIRSDQQKEYAAFHREVLTFFGTQEQSGFFSTTVQQVVIRVNVETNTFSIENGIEAKISLRKFNANEIQQVTYRNADCLKVAVDRRPKEVRSYVVTFHFFDKQRAPIDFNMAGKQCNLLTKCLQQVEKSMINEHDLQKHMFVIKQHLVPADSTKTVTYNMFGLQSKPVKTVSQTLVEHQFTDENQACVKFNVIIEPQGQQKTKTKRQIQVCQNQFTCAIEIHYLLPYGSVIHHLIQANRPGVMYKRSLELMLSGPLVHIVEFESNFKLNQFLQLIKMFKMRELYELQITDTHQGTKPIENQLYLIPPIMQNKFTCEQESPSNNQDGFQEIQEFGRISSIPIKVKSVSWNNARTPQKPLFDLILPDPYQYDIIAYGLQECVRADKRNCFEELRIYLKYYEFVEVDFVEMWELMLCVFVKRKHLDFMHSRSQNNIALGVGGYFGNKGGLNIQFSLYERTFSFINCHLTHGANSDQARLDMMADILKKVQPKVQKATHRIETDAVCDFNFIIGDLNSRFNRTFEQHISEVHLSPQMIPAYDQLYLAFQRRLYPGYQEPQITFMPTYKREIFDNNTYVNKKDQCPSYTDRVLFRNNTKCAVHLHEYTSIDQQFGSDHRPVALTITIDVQPLDYINPAILLNSLLPDQGRGEIRILNMEVQIDHQSLKLNNQRFSFPVFVQPRFISEWLLAKPAGCEKRYKSETKIQNGAKVWNQDELPMLFTAINSRQILSSRNLTIAFAMSEGSYTSTDNFAYANIDMDHFLPVQGSDCKLPSDAQSVAPSEQNGKDDWEYFRFEPKAKLISRNNHIGTVSITLLYRVKGRTQLDPNEMQLQLQLIEERNRQIANTIIKNMESAKSQEETKTQQHLHARGVQENVYSPLDPTQDEMTFLLAQPPSPLVQAKEEPKNAQEQPVIQAQQAFNSLNLSYFPQENEIKAQEQNFVPTLELYHQEDEAQLEQKLEVPHIELEQPSHEAITELKVVEQKGDQPNMKEPEQTYEGQGINESGYW